MTEIQKRIFLWKRAKALTVRYHDSETGKAYGEMPGFLTAGTYVMLAAQYVERGKYFKKKHCRSLADLLRRMWMTGNPHTDWL